MRVIVQRAICSKVEVGNKIVGQSDNGYMLLVGFTHSDTELEINHLAKKIIGLRIFADEQGKLNKSIKDIGGSILAISQFTLYADARKGNRPGFTDSMNYEQANEMFDKFVEKLRSYEVEGQTGVFGADMNVSLINVGPTTIILDSKELM